MTKVVLYPGTRVGNLDLPQLWYLFYYVTLLRSYIFHYVEGRSIQKSYDENLGSVVHPFGFVSDSSGHLHNTKVAVASKVFGRSSWCIHSLVWKGTKIGGRFLLSVGSSEGSIPGYTGPCLYSTGVLRKNFKNRVSLKYFYYFTNKIQSFKFYQTIRRNQLILSQRCKKK